MQPIALLSLMVAAAPGGEAPAPVRDAVLTATRALFDALTEGRPEVWERTMAPDGLVVDEFGRRQDRASLLEHIRPLPPGFSGTIDVRSPRVRAYGDTAVIEFECHEEEAVFGQKLVVRYASTATYVRQEGAWKLVLLTSVTIPTPPPAVPVRDLRLDDYPGTYRYGPDRQWLVSVDGGKLVFRTVAGRPPTALVPVARDVFMDAGEEKNLVVFRRGAGGRVEELIQRRKFNDLHLTRER
jgi:hypothetical protein